MSREDIADLRRRHRQAVQRSLQAGYDLVYVYAAHGLTTLQHFLSRRYNLRDDEYGGTLENRARLLREVLEDTLEECEGRAAVACRLVVDELLGEQGIERPEIEQLFALVGELPDVWDVMVGFWPDDSRTSRFTHEAWTEEHFRGLKQLTSKPVVGIGWLTSPGHDGAADPRRRDRPDRRGAPLDRRPVPAGEDRGGPARGHPRVHRLQHLRHRRLDVDADPLHAEPVDGRGVAARLASRALPAGGIRREGARRRRRPGRARGGDGARQARLRGHARRGGRASSAAGCCARRGCPVSPPGSGSSTTAAASSRSCRTSSSRSRARSPPTRCAAYGFDHVAVATGARWRADGVGRWHTRPLALDPAVEMLTPDDLLAGRAARGRAVLLFDDDHYYLGGVLAELLAAEGKQVTLVTPAAARLGVDVNTMEQTRIHRRLVEAGVELATVAGARRASRAAWRASSTSTPSARARAPRRRARPRDGAPAERRARPASSGATGDRRRVRTRHDRDRRLGRPPLRRGARRRRRTATRVPFRREVVELAPLGVEVSGDERRPSRARRRSSRSTAPLR